LPNQSERDKALDLNYGDFEVQKGKYILSGITGLPVRFNFQKVANFTEKWQKDKWF